MFELFANSEDPDQTLRSAASDLCLHCLPTTVLGVSRLQWVKETVHFKGGNTIKIIFAIFFCSHSEQILSF